MAVSRLTSSRFPYLPVHLEVRRGVHDLEALLDTGFDGDIALPTDLIMNGDPPDGHQRWRLADGSTALAPFYLGIVKLATTELSDIHVTAMGDEPIVGRGIISQFTLILDHGRRVVVEP